MQNYKKTINQVREGSSIGVQLTSCVFDLDLTDQYIDNFYLTEQLNPNLLNKLYSDIYEVF